jgi:hypothetical protein
MLSTCGILAYVLLAALNARATYDADSMTFVYCNHIRWLPASIDGKSTWQTFWNLLALAFCFWAARDWLQASASPDPQAGSFQSILPGFVSPLSPRLKSLLWVLTISGGLLGLEGIIQRLSGSTKLLFLITPEFHKEAQEQFGSYAYRASAVQYFNLLWPVCLGFWWTSSRSSGGRHVTSHLLLACAAVMAACPVIASARGAALMDLALLPIATSTLMLWPIFGYTDPTQIRTRSTVLLLVFFISALTLGLGLGWKQLLPRLDNLAFGLHERERLYDCARRIAADYPWFGTGPGTFEKVFQLYRGSVDGYWPAQLHNDWLETRVTFGWIGSGMIAMGILLIMLMLQNRVCTRRAYPLDFVLGLSLLGCLLQARWDFPLQIYSILFLFVIWCSVLCGAVLQTVERSHVVSHALKPTGNEARCLQMTSPRS